MMESGYKPDILPESKFPESADEDDLEKEDSFSSSSSKKTSDSK